jgi:hypothetical protein
MFLLSLQNQFILNCYQYHKKGSSNNEIEYIFAKIVLSEKQEYNF